MPGPAAKEVCGLRWRRDISPSARTLSIRIARTLVDGIPVKAAEVPGRAPYAPRWATP